MISKTFSSKIFGHLKILAHLVNNLVESDDNLELVEQLLKIPEIRSTNITIDDKTKDTSNTKRDPSEKPSNFEKIFESFLKENQSLKD